MHFGPVVKRLRHRPFTAVTRVRFPSGSVIACRCGSILLDGPRQSRAEPDYKSAVLPKAIPYADVAQLAEQLICNQQVIGSSPIIGFVPEGTVSFWTFSSVG